MEIQNVFGHIKKAMLDNATETPETPSISHDEMQRKLEALGEEVDQLGANNKFEQQPSSSYESRRLAVEKSTEQIEGIFYILDGKIIPDYYSECLFSKVEAGFFSDANKQNPRKRAMYHDYFFKHYVSGICGDIASHAKHLPRGRVEKRSEESSNILIDQCYFKDEEMLRNVIGFYRLSGRITVSTNYDYRCPDCSIEHLGRIQTYVLQNSLKG